MYTQFGTVLLVASFSLYTACDRTTQPGSQANTYTPTNTTPGAPDTGSTDPRGDVEKALRAMLEAHSYRVKSELSSTGGRTQTREQEYVAPDRVHVTLEANGQRREFIVIGSDSYVRTGDEAWKKGPLSVIEKLSQFYPKEFTDKSKDWSDVKYVSTETLDGKQTRLFESNAKDSLHPGKERLIRIWIGSADGLPYRIEIEMETEVEGAPVKQKLTRQLSDYNADITIKAPI